LPVSGNALLLFTKAYFHYFGELFRKTRDYHISTKMKRIILLIVISFVCTYANYSKAQNEDIDSLFQKFVKLYGSGDLVGAEETLLSVVNSQKPIPEKYLVAAYNNLGAVTSLLGRFDEALDYINRAENQISNKQQNAGNLADIYNNKGRIYTIQKSYYSAIEHFEKGIRILDEINNPDKSVLQSISSAYLNIGIAYYEIKDYTTASKFFNKSAELKLKHNLTGIALVYTNIAKTYAKTANTLKAQEFYLKSISSFIKEFGKDYLRLAEVYIDYGLFLSSVGKDSLSFETLNKALTIFRKNYGKKHTLVSLSYKHIGNYYKNHSDYDSALIYYQKALIAVVKDFNNADIYANPSIDSALFDIRLLDNLKSKTQALDLLASQQNDRGIKLKMMNKSLETIELALKLIDRLRNNYLSEESRIYLVENEKETYLFAIHLAFNLFKLTQENYMGLKMYDIAKKAKAAILRNEITGNELLWTAGITDSLREKQTRLSGNIAAYNNLIIEELRKIKPESNKIALWKDALFDMNRKKEKVTDDINKEFPQYRDLLQKTEPISLNEIQKQLNRQETVIDYLLSNQYIDGKRKLYTFIITKNRLEFSENDLDSMFIRSAEIIHKGDRPGIESIDQNGNFKSYTEALFYMYENLIKPFEGSFRGKKLIIIPDEEIAWLPFDAFIRNRPLSTQTDYEGLPYLIDDYVFSYGYSSSLILTKGSKLKKDREVFAFSPQYGKNSFSGNELDYLLGAGKEIESVFKWFPGKKFLGSQATETNFKEATRNAAILHLAMHSLSDSTNSNYSYLVFDNSDDNREDGKLYNYEISLSRIKSPMVVLSACNSGTGTLYHGEGLMSLARGFILAGTSSVIKTAWEVNDESSSEIITKFYYNLSKGKPKDEAMRQAKLEYLKNSLPSTTNPYYWAAYEVMGDNAPVVRNNSISILLLISFALIVLAGLMTIYLRRCNIFSACSE
jgi:CHAT domain-containing protein